METPSLIDKISALEDANRLLNELNLKEADSLKQLDEYQILETQRINNDYDNKNKNMCQYLKKFMHLESFPRISHLNLSKNSHVTSAFIDQLDRHDMIS